MKNMKVRIVKDPFRIGTSIIFYYERGGKIYALKSKEEMQFVECVEGENYPIAIHIPEYDQDTLVNLSLELCRLGIKPDTEQAHIDTMKATERHLEDMRTIVMHQLKIK